MSAPPSSGSPGACLHATPFNHHPKRPPPRVVNPMLPHSLSSGGKRHKKRQKGRGVAASLEEANPVQSANHAVGGSGRRRPSRHGNPAEAQVQGKGQGEGQEGQEGRGGGGGGHQHDPKIRRRTAARKRRQRKTRRSDPPRPVRATAAMAGPRRRLRRQAFSLASLPLDPPLPARIAPPGYFFFFPFSCFR